MSQNFYIRPHIIKYFKSILGIVSEKARLAIYNYIYFNSSFRNLTNDQIQPIFYIVFLILSNKTYFWRNPPTCHKNFKFCIAQGFSYFSKIFLSVNYELNLVLLPYGCETLESVVRRRFLWSKFDLI
jgi:hypothetical protein